MKTRIIIVLIACLSGIHPQTSFGEPIEGAFGFKLGEVFDPTNAAKTASEICYFPVDESRSVHKTVPIYFVSVTNATKAFYKIFLEITPKSHIIYRITAKGNEFSKEEREALESTLRSKYDSTATGSLSHDKVIDQSNRYVRIRSVRQPSVYINIPASVHSELTYTDHGLLKQALKEEAEMKFDKNSGL